MIWWSSRPTTSWNRFSPPEMNDTDYIRRTLELARRGTALASPGPMVGAVLVKDGTVVGEGFYTWDGVHHAEVHALRQAGDAARGSTAYTSLEPCAHTGRTPPCAQALIDAGVSRVVSAIQDPDPRVNGKGFAMGKSLPRTGSHSGSPRKSRARRCRVCGTRWMQPSRAAELF